MSQFSVCFRPFNLPIKIPRVIDIVVRTMVHDLWPSRKYMRSERDHAAMVNRASLASELHRKCHTKSWCHQFMWLSFKPCYTMYMV